MRIVFLSRYQHHVERGVENYVSVLAPRLEKLGHRVEVLTSITELIGKKPDVIYPLNGGFQSLFCRIYSLIMGAKLVLGGHAGIGRDDRWNLYLFPDLFIAFSKKGYKWAKSVNPMIRIIRIPHGIDLKKFNPNIKPVKLNLEHPVFITVSHLLPYKRIGETVKAVVRLGRGSLIVVGSGPEEKNVDELGKKLLGPKRYLRLKTSHNVVPSYLRSADVFTLCSGSQEAFGLVYLEALACNLPIVATDDNLRHELIGDAGLFVKNPEDSGEYAATLEKAAMMKWGNRPRTQTEKFGWEKIVNDYEKEFQTLVLSRRAG